MTDMVEKVQQIWPFVMSMDREMVSSSRQVRGLGPSRDPAALLRVDGLGSEDGGLVDQNKPPPEQLMVLPWCHKMWT